MSNIPMTRPEEALAVDHTSFFSKSTFVELDKGRVLQSIGKEFINSDDGGITWSEPITLKDKNGDIVGGGNGALVKLSGKGIGLQATVGLPDTPQRETPEQKMTRAGLLAAGETLRLLHEAAFVDDAALAHAYEDIPIPVRLPTPDRVEWARGVLAQVHAGEPVKPWDRMVAYGVTLLQDEFADRPIDTVPVHGVRIGDVALATQPCELYCQLGLDIKRRSPARHTAICGIADGYNGYCPTPSGILGGGYSGEPMHWCRLAADGGYRIVDGAARLLHQLWRA